MKSNLRIGVLDYTLDLSVRTYIDRVVEAVEQLGPRFERFQPGDTPPPDVDVLWDPRLTGWTPPWFRLVKANLPLVVTLHGAQPFTTVPWDYYPSVQSAASGLWRAGRGWLHVNRWVRRMASVIVPSENARREVARRSLIPRRKLVAIHHGVDRRVFYPDAVGSPAGPFLHVSAYQPFKNLHRILEAVANTSDLRLHAVAPGMPPVPHCERITIDREPKSATEVATLMRNSQAFVFPSLAESFGLPLIEAMASGCPVITSNRGACAEVADKAPIYVDPYSVSEIATAMGLLARDPALRAKHRASGLDRSAEFSWHRSAEQHLEVFERARSWRG